MNSMNNKRVELLENKEEMVSLQEVFEEKSVGKIVEVSYSLDREGLIDSLNKGVGDYPHKTIRETVTDEKLLEKLIKLAELYDPEIDDLIEVSLHKGVEYQINIRKMKVVAKIVIVEFPKLMSIKELIESYEERTKMVLEKKVGLEKELEFIIKSTKENEAEMVRWINEQGSEYLKDIYNLGYKTEETYVEERSTKEFPDYELDYKKSCEWRKSYRPGRKLINEVKELRDKGYDAEVVIIEAPIIGDEYESGYYWQDFEQYKTIVIKNYLNHNWLVKKSN